MPCGFGAWRSHRITEQVLIISIMATTTCSFFLVGAQTDNVGTEREDRQVGSSEAATRRLVNDGQGSEIARWRQMIATRDDQERLRCRILSPRDGRLLAWASPFEVVVRVDGTGPSAYVMRIRVNDDVKEAAASDATTIFRVDGLSDAAVSIKLVVYTANKGSNRSRVCIDEVELGSQTLMMKIFHPSHQDPVVVSPACPLIVNFGLVLCNSGVPDCYANVEGDQFAGVNMYVNDEFYSNFNFSRIKITNLVDILQRRGEGNIDGQRYGISIALVMLDINGVEIAGLHSGLHASIILKDAMAPSACHQYMSNALHAFGRNSKLLARNPFSADHVMEMYALNADFEETWDVAGEQGKILSCTRSDGITTASSNRTSKADDNSTCSAATSEDKDEQSQSIVAYTFVTADPTDLIFQVRS
eukprot:764739-Hanusia_phi.AAC.1